MLDHTEEKTTEEKTAEEKTTDERLSRLCLIAGFPTHTKGYVFLKDAVKRVLVKPSALSRMTKELYPGL